MRPAHAKVQDEVPQQSGAASSRRRARKPTSNRNLVVYAMGTYGDVHPLLGLAQMLRNKGWNVHFLTNAKFAPLVRQMHLRFVEVSTEAQYERAYGDPSTWLDDNSSLHMTAFHVPAVAPAYRALQQLHREEGISLVLGTNRFNGCAFACEECDIPYVPIKLAPFGNHNLRAQVRGSSRPSSRKLGAAVRRLVNQGRKYGYYRKFINPCLNPVRRELNLEPYRCSNLKDWRDYELCMCLYPEWYGPVEPGCHPRMKFANFPRFDPVDPAARVHVDRILSEFSKKPLVFVVGSGVQQIEKEVEEAALICESLDRPGLFASKYVDQLASTRVGKVHLLEYVDFAHLLPKSALVMHHGGIGTTAQALAAGVPQFVRWMRFDQPDNADRLRQLGVAAGVSKKDFSLSACIVELRHLLHSPEVAKRARLLGRLVSAESGLERAAAHLHEHATNLALA